MNFENYFPIYDKLTENEKTALKENAVLRNFKKGDVVHTGNDCMGLLLIRTGQLRAFIMSEEGKEITVYRLFERDVCLFSASCIMRSIQFDINITAEKDTEVWLIPVELYQRLMHSSAPLANFTNEVMGTRFTDVMWLVEQVLWKSFDKRLAAFLCEEVKLEGTNILTMTHEQIAAHLGTAREVVTRMLKYFQSEGYVSLARGRVEITDTKTLYDLSE